VTTWKGKTKKKKEEKEKRKRDLFQHFNDFNSRLSFY